MKLRSLILSGLVATGAMMAMANSASAYVVCNRDGDCWRTRERYDYRPSYGLRVYDDNWRWRSGERYRWRHHEGRGYWGRGGVWVTF